MSIYQGTTAQILFQVQQMLRLADADCTYPGLALSWINLGFIDVVQRTECLQKTDSAILTSGCDTFDLPAEVLTIKKLVNVYPDGRVSRPYRAVDLETMLEIRRSTIMSPYEPYDRPLYTLVGENQLEIWPIPDGSWSLQFWYVRYPQQLTTSVSVPEIREPWGSQTIAYAACVEAGRFKKDPLLSDWEVTYQYWIDRFQAHINRGRNLSQFIFAPQVELMPHDPSTDRFEWYR